MAATAVLTVCFVLLAVAVGTTWTPLHRVDERVATWGFDQTYGHVGLSAWWRGVAFWGQPLLQRVVMLMVAAILLLRRHRLTGLWLVLLVAAENVIAPAAKVILGRARPEWDHPIAVEHSLSFPSGHATAAAAFGLALLLVTPLLSDRAWLRVALRSVSVAVALIICADRVFLGVHYLTDVVGGVLLGFLMTTLAWVLLGVSRQRWGGGSSSTRGPSRTWRASAGRRA